MKFNIIVLSTTVLFLLISFGVAKINNMRNDFHRQVCLREMYDQCVANGTHTNISGDNSCESIAPHLCQ